MVVEKYSFLTFLFFTWDTYFPPSFPGPVLEGLLPLDFLEVLFRFVFLLPIFFVLYIVTSVISIVTAIVI